MNLLHGAAPTLSIRTREFLDSTAWSDAVCEPLIGDASTRKYFRLRKEASSAILMDASQNRESVEPFIRIGQHLARLGFSVPAILARADDKGLLVVEDFGDETFARLLENQGDPEKLYALATDVLIALHKHSQAIPRNLRVYHPQTLLEEIELFLECR